MKEVISLPSEYLSIFLSFRTVLLRPWKGTQCSNNCDKEVETEAAQYEQGGIVIYHSRPQRLSSLEELSNLYLCVPFLMCGFFVFVVVNSYPSKFFH